MTSDELKIRNAQFLRTLVGNMPDRKADPSVHILMGVALVIAEVGSNIAEQICELREAIERKQR